MKKITYLLILGLISLMANKINATIIQVAAPADLNATASGIVGAAADGDIIELTTSGGAYTWTTKISTQTKSVTIRAAAGLVAKPIITIPSGVFMATSNNTTAISITLDGIEFIGNSSTTNFISAKSTSTGNVALTVDNCYFHNFPATVALLAYSASGTGWSTSNYYSELKVSNSVFDGMATLFLCNVVNATPNKITVSNCYFVNMQGTVLGTALNYAPGGFVIDHCTFDNCATTASKYELYIGAKTGYLTPAIITNTLFANRPATSTAANVFGTAVSGSPNSNNAVYYPIGNIATIYPAALNYSITSDPVIANKVATAAGYMNAGSDGKTIGYYGNSMSAPTISTSLTAISGLGYAQGGSSTSQSFTVTGSNMSSGILVTAPANFEVSADNATFASSFTLGTSGSISGTVYVRAINGLIAATYNDNVVLTSTNASQKNVSVSATVNTVTGIEGLRDNYRLLVNGNSITVLLYNLANNIELYSIEGVLIDRTITFGTYAHKLNKGLYVIRINGKSTKFVL